MRIWFSPRCNTGFESLARTGRRVEDAIHHMKTKMTSIKTTLLVAGLLVAFAGASRAAEVKENWEKNCQKCHGPDGKGQTKMGRQSGVKDYTDPKVQAGMKDENAIKIIKQGIVEKDKKKMDPYKDKFTDEEIKALIAYIRGFKK
jgi:mono/diheme cytochrome c family protein